jgi:large subunit ribosomal protein L23
MALFGTKKTAKKASASAEPKKARDIADVTGKLENVITAPWLSEKALIGTEKGVYVFKVPASATKTEIAAAIEKIYKVVPRKVAVVNLPAKRKALRKKRGFGTQAARTKAYVYLAKGDTITFA